ncbi:MAG: hypothetical protein ABIB71_00205 [Candidatus Woesearchaeota archaeon]
MKMHKGLLLLSAGIDSPVAGYLMLKKKVELVCLHFDNQPLVNASAVEKVKRLIKKLKEYSEKPIKLYIVNHGRNQVEIIRNTDRRYQCVLCRRLMLKTAENIAEKEKCSFLITGENLGQVASQTIKNLTNSDKGVKITILRPLLCNDKEETVRLAKEIGTYGISTEAGMCCTAVPPNPITKSRIERIEKEEGKLNIAKMIEKSLSEAEVLEI